MLIIIGRVAEQTGNNNSADAPSVASRRLPLIILQLRIFQDIMFSATRSTAFRVPLRRV